MNSRESDLLELDLILRAFRGLIVLASVWCQFMQRNGVITVANNIISK